MLRNGVGSRRWRSENMADLEFCSSAVKGEEVHVLAVDDSLVDRKVIERLLKITSCKVTAVDSGRRALQFLGLDEEKSSSVGFDGLKVDLVITDYCMPGMTGYELLKKIKESSTLREIPVVIMSSENVMARIDRCLEEGAEDFLVKPVKLADVKRLREYMTTTRDVRTRRGEDDETSSNNSNKRKLRESCSDISLSSSSESAPSPPSISSSPSSMSILSSSPSPSPSPPSLSPSPSVVLSSSAPSSPSSSPLDSPTRRLKMTGPEQIRSRAIL